MPRPTHFRRAARAAVALIAVLTIVSVPAAMAATTTTVDLGQASTYAVLSGASVGNTVSAAGAPFTTLRGDLGVLANTQPTGFPPGVVTGAIRVGTTVTQAYTDLSTAYNAVANRPAGTAIAGDLAGTTLTPGLYTAAGAIANTGTLTLDGGGNPNAVFVLQVGGALNMAAASQVTLTDGAQASNVFWQVNGAAAIGAGAKFAGTVMALDAIAIGAGTEVNGRALALDGAISLDNNEFYSAPPTVTIDGGATGITNDATPTIAGTTDVVAPAVVTVTIAGQTLTATPSGGTWSITSALLANGTYPVVASVTDGAGNQGNATQQLTIDTVPPVITIDGGTSVITNDPNRAIAGTSDVAPGTVVDVGVDGQTLTALVQSGGTWNVSPTDVSDGTWTVTASVSDPAGNESSQSQLLTVDTVAPAVTINGGATALTDDATPDISGTANVPAGTPVTVTLADQTLTGPVQSDGTWSVTPAVLSNGSHRVVLTVSDAAGNEATYTQTLTVDTVAPLIAITGGATASTNTADPVIRGTSNAAPGTIITVSIAGQTITTLLQANGTWNASPTAVANGAWRVIASAPDPAGNVGTATQMLTIASPSGSGGTGSTGSTGAKGTTGGTGSNGGTGSKGGTGTTGGSGSTGANGSTGAGASPTMSLSSTTLTAAPGRPVQVRFVLKRAAKVTLTVLRGKRVVARRSASFRKAGRDRLTWNGKIDGRPAPAGIYKVILRAVSPSGARTRAVTTVHVT